MNCIDGVHVKPCKMANFILSKFGKRRPRPTSVSATSAAAGGAAEDDDEDPCYRDFASMSHYSRKPQTPTHGPPPGAGFDGAFMEESKESPQSAHSGDSGSSGDSNQKLVIADYTQPVDAIVSGINLGIPAPTGKHKVSPAAPTPSDEDYTEPYEIKKAAEDFQGQAESEGGHDQQGAAGQPVSANSKGVYALAKKENSKPPGKPKMKFSPKKPSARGAVAAEDIGGSDYDKLSIGPACGMDGQEVSESYGQLYTIECSSESSDSAYQEPWDKLASVERELADQKRPRIGGLAVKGTGMGAKIPPSKISPKRLPLRQSDSIVKSDASPSATSAVTYCQPWDLGIAQQQICQSFQASAAQPSTSGVSSASSAHQPVGQQAPTCKKTLSHDQSPGKSPHRQKLSSASSSVLSQKPGISADGVVGGMYESPWDTAEKQKELEERLKAARISPKHKTESSKPVFDYANKHAHPASKSLEASPLRERSVLVVVAGDGEVYEEPWDVSSRGKAISDMLTGSDGKSSTSTRRQGSTASSSAANKADIGAKTKHGMKLDLGAAKAWSAIGEVIDPSIPLDKQSWYHGTIGRIDAESMLRVCREGSYLVRNSESTKQDYSLSMRSCRGFIHIKISRDKDRYILGENSQPFDSIPAMIYHYSRNVLPIKGADHMILLHPVYNELL